MPGPQGTGPNRFIRWVRGLDGEFYLRREVAEVLGVAPTTLKDWAERDEELRPTAYGYVGEVCVYLYTADDVQRLREHAERRWPVRRNGSRTRKKGHPQLWTPAELVARKAARDRAYSAFRRGDVAAAERIRAELEEAYQRRRMVRKNTPGMVS